jgi:hypothetical protein
MRNPFLVLVSLTIVAAPAAAQVAVDVGPLIGYYRPFGRFAPASIMSTDMPTQPSDLSGRLWGAEAHVTMHGRFGVDALGATATSTLPSCLCPEGPTGETHARVNLAVVEGQYDLSLAPDRYHLWLGAGPSIVQHAGTGYARYGSPTSVAGGLSLHFAAPLGSHVQLAASAMGLRYSFNLDFPPEHGPQLDGLASVGLRWHWVEGSVP